MLLRILDVFDVRVVALAAVDRTSAHAAKFA
jgi:hypothetical protein